MIGFRFEMRWVDLSPTPFKLSSIPLGLVAVGYLQQPFREVQEEPRAETIWLFRFCSLTLIGERDETGCRLG